MAWKRREIHEEIKKRISSALAGRTLKWLAETSGVPQSTLASQWVKPRFSLEVLVQVSIALDKSPSDFLPGELSEDHPPSPKTAEEILEGIEDGFAALKSRLRMEEKVV